MFDAVVIAGIFIFIFGGGYFVIALIVFSIQNMWQNHLHHIHCQRILEAIQHRWYETH